MIHWSESTNSKCRDKLPNGLRCRAKAICPRLAKKGLCKQKWITLKPDKKCLYNVKRQAHFKSVKKFCQKSCVCGSGKWSKWSSWSSCSKTCDWGTMERTRSCGGKKGASNKCKGKSKQQTACSQQPVCNCGIDLGRIVGGSEVTPYSVPWQVALQTHGNDGGFPVCGGTLLGSRHVLTAAHCVNQGDINFDVVVGEHTISNSSDGATHKVCDITVHPDYQKEQLFDYDFAIIRLKSPVAFDSKSNVACLPLDQFKGDALAGENGTISGWGRQDEIENGGESSDDLMSVEVPLLTEDLCNEYYAKYPFFYNFRPITKRMICAGTTKGGIDSCAGDSGGPLTYESGGKTYVVGVVSFGLGCGRPETPGVYSRVTEVRSWIIEQMQRNC